MATKTFTISVPVNDWKPESEIRPEVVQRICNAFLSGHRFCPNVLVGNRTPYVITWNDRNGKQHDNFSTTPSGYNDHNSVRFNAAELQKAVETLKEAGYYFYYEITQYYAGCTYDYICSKYPSMERWTKTDSIILTADFDR